MLEQYSKIYVTGGAGWIGSNLLEGLMTGISHNLLHTPALHSIRCLVLPGQKLSTSLKPQSNQVEVIEGNITNLEDCRHFLNNGKDGLLIHLAGIIHPNRVKDFYRINLNGTKNLLQAAKEGQIKRVVIMSSNSPIGNNPHTEHVFDEESPYHPYMNYGKSKYKMELAVKEFQKENSVETVIIRAPWFYGPQQPERQTLFFKLIRDGKFPVVGTGNNRRSMAYVDNLTQGILLAADSGAAAGEIFWIADERPYTMMEIIKTIQSILQDEFKIKVKTRVLQLPFLLGEIATGMDAAIQSLGVYQQKIHVLSEMNKTIACTIEKARNILHYQPQVDLREGMKRSIQWCIEKGYLQ